MSLAANWLHAIGAKSATQMAVILFAIGVIALITVLRLSFGRSEHGRQWGVSILGGVLSAGLLALLIGPWRGEGKQKVDLNDPETRGNIPPSSFDPGAEDVTDTLAVRVSAGFGYTCAVTRRGTALCWGRNQDGQVGNGSEGGVVRTPTRVSGGIRFTSISSGGQTCGVDINSIGYCWGPDPGYGPESSPVPVRISGSIQFLSISAGHVHSCGISTVGAGYCWGDNSYGAFGNGTTKSSQTPVPISGGLRFAALSVNAWATCGVTRPGQLFCWGTAWKDFAHDSIRVRNLFPATSEGIPVLQEVDTDLGFGCTISATHSAYCFGDNNESGQLGNGRVAPKGFTEFGPVASLLRFRQLSVGASHVCAITEQGKAFCWGRNRFGQLGNGSTRDSPVPVAVTGDLIFANISAGDLHTCAVTVSGLVYCWGENQESQIGVEGVGPFLAPVHVSLRT